MQKIKCISFLNGKTIIFTHQNSNIYNAFYIDIFTDKDSKERRFVYEPIMPYKFDQNLSESEASKLFMHPDFISEYEPDDNVKNAYIYFVDNSIGSSLQKYLSECGPSKEWVENHNKLLEEANSISHKNHNHKDGNIIKGVFSSNAEVVEE